MASSRKPRIANKRTGKVTDGAADKEDGGGTYKNRQRKRKLSDMLGPQWSKEELENFYDAYRKYEKDWRKVAAAIRNRTTEMVEALYGMNKAYLSLPDGTVSKTGFIAMMIDHYNILEGNNSDGDSSDGYRASERPQKQTRLKQKQNITNNSDGCHNNWLPCRSGPSNYGCPSPPKKRRSGVELAAGGRPRVVGKRTPRFPVSSTVEKRGAEAVLFSKRDPDSDGDNDDYDVAKAAALTLAEASQRAASPQISRTPSRTTVQMRSSPVQNGDIKGFYARNESGVSAIKHSGSTMDEGGFEGSQESREVGNGSVGKADEPILPEETGPEAARNLKSKVRKLPVKKIKPQGSEHKHFDDIKEECSCTEEGIGLKDEKNDIMDTEAVDTRRRKKPPPQRSRKRSRQLFCADQNFGLNALATLAEGLLPSPTTDSESSVQVKEEKKENGVLEKPERIGQRVREVDHHEEKPRVSLNRERGSLYKNSVNSIEVETKEKHHEDARNVALEGEHDSLVIDLKKRRRKPSAIKQLEALGETSSREIQKFEALIGDGTKFRNKTKRTANLHTLSKQGRLVKSLPVSASDPEIAAPGRSVTEPATQKSTASQVSLPTKLRSRRKRSQNGALTSKSGENPENSENIVVSEQFELPHNVTVFCPHTVTDRVSSMKAKLTHCLSSEKLRRWCTYEWFYSAIDWPWFARNEFVEYLNHAGLGHVPRLTRVEWGVIRSSLGKPRRLSKRFLQEEREKLEQYRESVRKHYNEVRAGVRDGLPTDLARPLSVGQRVIACHPKTREVHDGSILTVDRNRCRVQFDRPELGVEFVSDIDCMPLNPLENMPEALRRKNIVLEGLGRRFEDSQLEIKSRGWGVGSAPKIALNDRLDKAALAGPSFGPPSKYSFNMLLKQAKGDTVDSVIQAKAAANEVVAAAQQAMYNQPCTLAQIQAREADIRALAELTRALDKKEAILVELRHMNDEVDGNQKNGEAVRSSENFQKQYATVLHQLRDANEQVASALVYLRQRNTYQENSIPPWHHTTPAPSGVVGSSSMELTPTIALDNYPKVGEIINNSRRRARMLVDAAMQTISSLKDGEDGVRKFGPLDPIRYVDIGIDSGNLGSSQFDLSKGSEQETFNFRENSIVSFGSEQTAENAPDVKQRSVSERKEVLVPCDLITSCVAALLLIQTCTERPYTLSDMGQMLDGAVASLCPQSSQNLVIYREIQQSMNVVKNQIFSAIPTHPSIAISAELPSLSKK